mmetsp:Transcript_4327/g.15538  ORF Transcript_4327/g.15538 Transcript_4327/m.15538 type:complete len:117 (+) Transcript_4327:48-398(+)
MFAAGVKIQSPALAVAPQKRPTSTLRAPMSAHPRRSAVKAGLPIEGVLAAVAGVAFGIGIPMIFEAAEKRDAVRLEDVRELNRETLRTTGETLSDEELDELRPARYLDRREFKDDD